MYKYICILGQDQAPDGQDEAQDGQDEAQDGQDPAQESQDQAQDGQDEAFFAGPLSYPVPQKPTNIGGFWETGPRNLFVCFSPISFGTKCGGSGGL